jgi:hypothetical protein
MSVSRLDQALSPRPKAGLAIMAASLVLSLAACGEEDSGGAADAAGPTGATGASGPTFDDRLREELLATEELSDAEIDCVLERLRDRVSDAELGDASRGAVPPSVTREILLAGGVCSAEESSE